MKQTGVTVDGTKAGAVIETRDLAFSYAGGNRVMDGVDFRLAPGECVGLTGRNGAGKSTLLRLVMGLEKPSSGTISVFGGIRAEESDFMEVRTRVGYLFQDSDDQLFCPTVFEDVAFGPMNLGCDRREAENIVRDTLESLGMADYGSRITYRLSGGEKRLVALATVLAMKPEILLLDEPTAGLDEQATARVAEILAILPHAKLIVSQDETFLAALADRRVKLDRGRLTPDPRSI